MPVAAIAGGVAQGAATDVLSQVLNGSLNAAFATQMPARNEIISLWTRGLITDDLTQAYLRLYGFACNAEELIASDVTRDGSGFPNNAIVNTSFPLQWSANGRERYGNDWFVISAQWTPEIDEVTELWQRELIDNRLADKLLQLKGVKDKGLRSAVFKNSFEIPGPSELITFAIRDAFSPIYIERYGYQKDFPKFILPWMNKQGYGDSLGVPRPPEQTDDQGDAFPHDVTWADMYWYSHWDLPSLERGYLMFHQLYPTSPYGPSPIGSDDTWFTLEDMDLLHRANAVPTYWRKRYQATSFHPLTRVDVQRMLVENVITEADVYHDFRSLGYNDRNAQRMTRYTMKLAARRRANQGKGLTDTQIKDAFFEGAIDEAKAVEWLTSLGHTDEECQTIMHGWQLNRTTTRLKSHKKNIRYAFLYGYINDEQTFNALVSSGMDNHAVSDLISDWKFEREYTHKNVNAAEVIKWYISGIVNSADTTMHLQNLGYAGSDIYNMMQQANLIIEIPTKKDRDKTRAARIAAQEAAKLQSLREATANATRELDEGLYQLYHNNEIYMAQAIMRDDHLRDMIIQHMMRYRDISEQEANRIIDVSITHLEELANGPTLQQTESSEQSPNDETP